MLDFSELSPDGRDLELLTRELCLSLGYNVSWSGAGTDAGRDLLIEEVGDPLFGGKHRRWLVSCKSTAAANQGAGRSVGLADLGADGGILDSIDQHASDAYLLVCATQPSSAVVSRLEALEARSGKPMHIWDAVQLERLLTSPRNWRIAQHFLPVSSEASGLKVFYTESPNKFVVVTRGFYILAENRHGSYMAYQLSSIDMRLDRMEKIQATLPPGAELRPRMMWCDDKHGAFLWHFDYL